MKLSELKKLAEAVNYDPLKYGIQDMQKLHDYHVAANPQTILALLALIEKQHTALVSVRENYITDEEDVHEALAAYEEMK